jgi:hypothetical protein
MPRQKTAFASEERKRRAAAKQAMATLTKSNRCIGFIRRNKSSRYYAGSATKPRGAGGHARFSQQTRDSFDVLGWPGWCFFARPESQPQFGASEDVGCFRAGPVEALDSRSIAFRPQPSDGAGANLKSSRAARLLGLGHGRRSETAREPRITSKANQTSERSTCIERCSSAAAVSKGPPFATGQI